MFSKTIESLLQLCCLIFTLLRNDFRAAPFLFLINCQAGSTSTETTNCVGLVNSFSAKLLKVSIILVEAVQKNQIVEGNI